MADELERVLAGERGTPPDDDQNRWLDPLELRDRGYLLEVNRQFFHRIGLALAIVPLGDKADPATQWAVGVLDARDDPEGYVFGDLDAEDVRRARAVQAEMDDRAPRRQAALGYVVQPLPESTDG